MSIIKKVGEHKIKESIRDSYPCAICENCGEDLGTKIIYQEVSTEIEHDTYELLELHFEEHERSSCCGELVSMCNSSGDEISVDESYEYKTIS